MSTNAVTFENRPWSQTWLSEDTVDRIIAKLDAAHNGRLLSYIKNRSQQEVVRRTWAEKLGGLSGEQIKRGLQIAENMDGAPTPAQFRVLCCLDAPWPEGFRPLARPDFEALSTHSSPQGASRITRRASRLDSRDDCVVGLPRVSRSCDC